MLDIWSEKVVIWLLIPLKWNKSNSNWVQEIMPWKENSAAYVWGNLEDHGPTWNWREGKDPVTQGSTNRHHSSGPSRNNALPFHYFLYFWCYNYIIFPFPFLPPISPNDDYYSGYNETWGLDKRWKAFAVNGLTVNPRGSGPGFSMVNMEEVTVGEAVGMLCSTPALRREPQQDLAHTVVCWSPGIQAVCFENRFSQFHPHSS